MSEKEIPMILKRYNETFTSNDPMIEVESSPLFINYSSVNNDGFVKYFKGHVDNRFIKSWEADVHTIIQYMKKHKGFRDNLLREIDLEFTTDELKRWEK